MEAEPQPSTSPATRAPTARGNIITQAVLDSQERMADSLERLANSQERIAGALEALVSTMAKMHDTLIINTQKP